MLGGEPAIVFAHRGHGPRLHLSQALTAGKHRRAGLLLHHRPQRLLDQLGDVAAGPLPVIDFGEPLLDEGFESQCGGQRFQGHAAAQQG